MSFSSHFFYIFRTESGGPWHTCARKWHLCAPEWSHTHTQRKPTGAEKWHGVATHCVCTVPQKLSPVSCWALLWSPGNHSGSSLRSLSCSTLWCFQGICSFPVVWPEMSRHACSVLWHQHELPCVMGKWSDTEILLSGHPITFGACRPVGSCREPGGSGMPQYRQVWGRGQRIR